MKWTYMEKNVFLRLQGIEEHRQEMNGIKSYLELVLKGKEILVGSGEIKEAEWQKGERRLRWIKVGMHRCVKIDLGMNMDVVEEGIFLRKLWMY